MRAGLLLLLLPLLSPMFSQAKTLAPGYDEFLHACRSFRAADGRLKQSPLQGKITYLPTIVLQATQTRFAFVRLLQALRKWGHEEGLDDGSRMPHDDGRSPYARHRRITRVYYKGHVYIVDGHHRGMLASYFAAERVPVEIINDADEWDKLSEDEFWARMRADGYSHMTNFRGAAMAHRDLCDLLDDPYLKLARNLLGRVDWRMSRKGHVKIVDVRGAKRAILLKLNRDIPFLEFEIADRLRRAGFIWDHTRRLTDHELHRALEILTTRRNHSRLKHVLLLDKPTDVRELDLPAIIARHPSCAEQLAEGDGD